MYLPELVHVHWSLEDHENMSVVMGIHRLARIAEVLRAVSAAEPLALDRRHAAVT
jgi:hypothetical protein